MRTDGEDIRCFCGRKPLLAVVGVDSDGHGFVHIKTWKGGKLYAEVVVTDGTAHLHCRECLRWHTVRIVRERVKVTQERLPSAIAV